MRIAQIVVPGASEYERKSQRIDAVALAGAHEVVEASIDEVGDSAADVVHVYGAPPLRPSITIPYVASAEIARRRFQLRRPVGPRAVITPFTVPEAVEEKWFVDDRRPRLSEDAGQAGAPVLHRLGSYLRPSTRSLIELTLARIHRFRDDISWTLFDSPPAPADLRTVDAWVDPAVAEDDFDGFVAEALVFGKPVVASRTPVNESRLERSRTGFLVPRNDPNELTHAILAALFKREVAELKIDAARQTVGKFRPRQRLRALERIYESTVR